MARWIRLVKAHPTMASTWTTSIVLKYRTGEFGFPGDLRYYHGDLRGWKPGGYAYMVRLMVIAPLTTPEPIFAMKRSKNRI